MLMFGYHGSSVSWNGVLNGKVTDPSGPNSFGCGSSKRSNAKREFSTVRGPMTKLWSPVAREWLRWVGQFSLRSAGGGSEFSERRSDPQLPLLLNDIRCRVPNVWSMRDKYEL